MMKKLLVFLYFTIIPCLLLSAADSGNIHQEQCRVYIEQAKQALADKKYTEAEALAKKAEEEAELSKQWTAQQSIKITTQFEMSKATAQYIWIKENKIAISQEIMTEAKAALQQSNAFFADSDYKKATAFAELAMKLLTSIGTIEIPAEECLAEEPILNDDVLPAYYEVRKHEKLNDCLWFIASLPGVYNNPFLWKTLYHANKDILINPSNPHLILEGTILTIPSIYGEKREGLYDHSKKYPPLKQ